MAKKDTSKDYVVANCDLRQNLKFSTEFWLHLGCKLYFVFCIHSCWFVAEVNDYWLIVCFICVLCGLCGRKLIREVQICELAVVFFCGSVVCLCSVDFFFEISEKYELAVKVYPGEPFLFAFLPAYTFVFLKMNSLFWLLTCCSCYVRVLPAGCWLLDCPGRYD